ncbi:hypothetical protein [Microbacterium sp.]|uniref:DUF6998 domain-containing protein n=1 Tax=Microbacterium sp. TaxID=51671 RepID=UPI00262B9AD6|nr:hypothetical protein [Microbacterium sp.]
MTTTPVPDPPSRPLAAEPTPALLRQYAEILAELRERGVVRTSNAPLGDYAEHIALQVYGGTLAPNSAKSYDLVASDGQHVQVKARTVSPTTSPSAVFSVFRSFEFDTAALIVLDARTYDLKWARELSPDDVREASRWSSHVNGHLLQIRKAEKLGTDVTDKFAPEFGATAPASAPVSAKEHP